MYCYLNVIFYSKISSCIGRVYYFCFCFNPSLSAVEDGFKHNNLTSDVPYPIKIIHVQEQRGSSKREKNHSFPLQCISFLQWTCFSLSFRERDHRPMSSTVDKPNSRWPWKQCLVLICSFWKKKIWYCFMVFLM